MQECRLYARLPRLLTLQDHLRHDVGETIIIRDVIKGFVFSRACPHSLDVDCLDPICLHLEDHRPLDVFLALLEFISNLLQTQSRLPRRNELL